MLKLNCGLSYPEQSFEDEVKKVKLANQYGIDYVSVISIDKDRVNKLWEAISEIPRRFTLCSAPIYEMVLFDETPEETIKRQASYGVEAMTFHITPMKILIDARDHDYVINSRGGEFLLEKYDADPSYENPFYERFFELVDYAYSCGVKEIFLGTSLRPGACEPLSRWTKDELLLADKFYDTLWEKGFACQLEALGHVPYSQFKEYKEVLGNRMICSMGPLLTDSVNGFDEINAIIGYTLARQYGINITTECMLSRKEHIDMPTVEDVEDEIKKWRVTETCLGVVYEEPKALNDEKQVIDKKLKQRTQCSAHVNIFGAMDIIKTCRVCGDRCPLLRDKEQQE